MRQWLLFIAQLTEVAHIMVRMSEPLSCRTPIHLTIDCLESDSVIEEVLAERTS